MSITILGIESSCDDTSAAIVKDGVLLSNYIANQEVHKKYGGVVPELASRAHQQNIIPVVERALNESRIDKNEINAIAFTRGPGLLGSLLVGTSFAKGFALSNGAKLIEVNHLQGHILAPFIVKPGENKKVPELPFLCLLVSGGHTQIVVVKNHLEMEIIGHTIDDAAGEAFDKCAKIIGFEYPGGPKIDNLAPDGDPDKYMFAKPRISGLDFSFSGLKTSFLYFVRDQYADNPDFVKDNLADICASIQKTIIDILLEKIIKAVKKTGIKNIAIAGGVSANKGLRNALSDLSFKKGWELFVPDFKYCTDNAAMIAQVGYYKFMNKEFSDLDISPKARYNI